MLQSLLAERFKLAFHREQRALSGYALMLEKGGLKAKPSEPDADARTSSRWGIIEAAGCNMAHLALKLSEVLHLPVADFTAIPGAFDFKLEWTADDMRATPPATASPDAASGPSIFEALQEQRIRQRNYRVDKGGGVDYRRAAAQAAGVSSASR
jgi:uncharacterized protein (TIGR03435 family)